jgi:hypothetical protein
MNITKCTAHNGTYCCELEQGHTGLHQTEIRKEVNARNVVIARSRMVFQDNYSPVRRRAVSK